MSDRPPRIPEGEDLHRAIGLLDNRVESELQKDCREELKSLIGTYPSEAQAMAWKQFLKRMKKPEEVPEKAVEERDRKGSSK